MPYKTRNDNPREDHFSVMASISENCSTSRSLLTTFQQNPNRTKLSSSTSSTSSLPPSSSLLLLPTSSSLLSPSSSLSSPSLLLSSSFRRSLRRHDLSYFVACVTSASKKFIQKRQQQQQQQQQDFSNLRQLKNFNITTHQRFHIPLTFILVLILNSLAHLSTTEASVGSSSFKISDEQVIQQNSLDENNDGLETEKTRFNPNECSIYGNEGLHSLMDRVCELCHDMYSHQNANMRAECRSDCFSTGNFKKCLRLFKPLNRTTRQIRSRRYFY